MHFPQSQKSIRVINITPWSYGQIMGKMHFPQSQKSIRVINITPWSYGEIIYFKKHLRFELRIAGGEFRNASGSRSQNLYFQFQYKLLCNCLISTVSHTLGFSIERYLLNKTAWHVAIQLKFLKSRLGRVFESDPCQNIHHRKNAEIVSPHKSREFVACRGICLLFFWSRCI